MSKLTQYNHNLDFSFDDIFYVGKSSSSKISISGVQEKFPAVVENGKIRLATRSERSTHILKPIPADRSLRDRHCIPANECLTMQIASEVYHITTASHALCYASDGKPVYLTERFDILPDGNKLMMEDFASLLGKNEVTQGKHYKYSGSYEDIAIAIKQHLSAPMVELERFFNLLVFNYIYANGDAHLKNFSIIRGRDGSVLAPAYDLLNTALHVNDDDFALEEGLSPHLEKSDIWTRTGHPAKEDFINFGRMIGLKEKRIQSIVGNYSTLNPQTTDLIEASALPKKAKRIYLRILRERLSRFNRR